MFNSLIQLHENLFFNLHALVGISPFLDDVIYFFAQTADLYVIGFAMLFILVHQHKKHTNRESHQETLAIKELFLVTLAVLAAWFCTYILKQLIGGLRPFEFYEFLQPLFVYAGGDTFPSGHATLFSALALMMTVLHRRAGIVFVVFAILISITRVIAGVHYPIDIFAGWIIGGVISYLVYRAFKGRVG